jgi:hypothetical protein
VAVALTSWVVGLRIVGASNGPTKTGETRERVCGRAVTPLEIAVAGRVGGWEAGLDSLVGALFSARVRRWHCFSASGSAVGRVVARSGHLLTGVPRSLSETCSPYHLVVSTKANG